MFVGEGGRERGKGGEGEGRIKEGWQKEREGEREGLILGRGKIFAELKHSVKSSCRILVKTKNTGR